MSPRSPRPRYKYDLQSTEWREYVVNAARHVFFFFPIRFNLDERAFDGIDGIERIEGRKREKGGGKGRKRKRIA